MRKFPAHHCHTSFLAQIKTKHEKKARRAEIGKKLLKGVAKVMGIGRNVDKVPAKSQSPPSKSNYVKQRKASSTKDIGSLSPSITPPKYVQQKRRSTQEYDLKNQRKKVKIPYRHR